MSDQNAFNDVVAGMVRHVSQTGHPLYQPSKFWQQFNQINSDQLSRNGLDNFKRSVNQNYFNWIPTTPQDNQFRNVARHWGSDPVLDVLGVTLNGESDIGTAFSGNPLAIPETRQLYQLFVGFLWHYTRSVCRNGLTDVLVEPTLGNPLRCELNGRLISQDLANSIRERTTALLPMEPTMAAGRSVSIVEIGAGYGRLGFVFISSAPCQYTVVDIPPALGLSQWYLTTLFPQKRAFRFRPWQDFAQVQAELAAADIRFLTPDQFALCPAGYFDVGVTISTLSEMSRTQFDFYLSLLSRLTSKTIYTKQWIQHHNAADAVMIGRPDYVLPAPWRMIVDRVDGVQDAFFERQWVRSDQDTW